MRLMVAPMLLALVLLLTPPGWAYTGGPVRAEIAGYDSTTARAYFRLRAFDEAYYPPEVYYFALDSESPGRAVRDKSLEQEDRADWDRHPNLAWVSLARRLAPLLPSDVQPTVDVSADSLGVDPHYSVTRYQLKVRLAHDEAAGETNALAFCRPDVSVEGVYAVPGRAELLVVVTYVGRRYGCESVAQPLVLGVR